MLSGRQAEHARPASANAATPTAAPDASATHTRAAAISTGRARKITSGGILAEITATSRRPTVTAVQNTASARLAVESASARCWVQVDRPPIAEQGFADAVKKREDDP